ncbi:TPA: DnaJ domain-containing protein [Vibrio parahaemolyticus]
MIFRDREKARKAGVTRYMPDEKCPNGHLSERLVSNNQCCECRREYRIKSRKPKRTHKRQDRSYSVHGLPANLKQFFESLLDIDERLPEIKAWLDLRKLLTKSLGEMTGELEFRKNVNKYLAHGGVGHWKFKWSTDTTNYNFAYKDGSIEQSQEQNDRRSYRRQQHDRQQSNYKKWYDEYRKQQRNSQYQSKQAHSDSNNHLKILGFITGTKPTKIEVKKAYKRLSLIHHPDRGGCAEKFKELKNAYDKAINLCKV